MHNMGEQRNGGLSVQENNATAIWRCCPPSAGSPWDSACSHAKVAQGGQSPQVMDVAEEAEVSDPQSNSLGAAPGNSRTPGPGSSGALGHHVQEEAAAAKEPRQKQPTAAVAQCPFCTLPEK